jgi:5-methylthioadenosine/S-adenosylhomocysteine deaminase
MRSRVASTTAIRRRVEQADIVVLGGLVVTMDQQRTVLVDGAIAVRDGAIVAVGPRDVVGAEHQATRVIEASDTLIIPGLIDAHTHMPMTLFRGLADNLPLHTWLEKHIWPAERRFIHPETVRWGSRLGVAELLRSGVTTVCDMYFYEDEVATVVDELGGRAVLGQAFFDVTSPQGLDLEDNVSYAEQFIARWRGHPRIVPALAPHAPYTVSPELYRRLHALAERHDVLCSPTSRRRGTRTATCERATAAPPRAISPASVWWTNGSSPRTASGSTARRSSCSPPAVPA